MSDCLFCNIVKGKEKSYKVFENKKFICILDKYPVSKGHCLVITKKHFENMFEMNKSHLRELMLFTEKAASQIKRKLNANGINFIQSNGKIAQQTFFHFHMHIIPRYEGDGLDVWMKSDYQEKSFSRLLRKIKS